MADQSRSSSIAAGLQLSGREETHIITSPQNTPLLHQYPEWYTSTYVSLPNSVVHRNIESIHRNWGYWEFADLDHQAKAKSQGLDSPEELLSATTLTLMSSNGPFPTSITSKSGHPIQWNDSDAINLIWIPGRLDGTKGLHNGQPASASRHVREIQQRRTRHSLPSVRTPHEKYVYSGSYFRWYLEPGADLRYIRQWINSIAPLRSLSLGPSTAESIIAGFPEWKGRSLFGNSTNAISLHELYLHAADRRLKPDNFPMYRPPRQDGHTADTEDFTSYHPAVEDVMEKDFKNVCLTLNQMYKGDYLTLGWTKPPAVLDADGNVLRDPKGSGEMILDYPHLPMRISRCQGWWQRETWLRLDCRLVPDDLAMRKLGGENKPKRRSPQVDSASAEPGEQIKPSTVKPARVRDRAAEQAPRVPVRQDEKVMNEVAEALKYHTRKKPRQKKHDLKSSSQSPPLFDKTPREDNSEASSSERKYFGMADWQGGIKSAMADGTVPNVARAGSSNPDSVPGPTKVETHEAGIYRGHMFYPPQLGIAPSSVYPSFDTIETFGPEHRESGHGGGYSAWRDLMPPPTSSMLRTADGMSSNDRQPCEIRTDYSRDEQPTAIARAGYESGQPSQLAGTPPGYMETPSPSSRWTRVARMESTASPDQGRILSAYQTLPDPGMYPGYRQQQAQPRARNALGVEPLLSSPYVPTASMLAPHPLRPYWPLLESGARDVRFSDPPLRSSYGTPEANHNPAVTVGGNRSRAQAELRQSAPINTMVNTDIRATMYGSTFDPPGVNQDEVNRPFEALPAIRRNPGSGSLASTRQQASGTGASITGAEQRPVGMHLAPVAASSSNNGGMSNVLQKSSGFSEEDDSFVFDDGLAEIQE
ncbi:MAG: hypothetical protein Q9165_005459 [Trypethelium subeluteriae]